MRSKELRQDRAKLVADARALVEKKDPTAEDSAKFDELMAKADAIKADIDRIERLEDAEKELGEKIEMRADRRGISPGQQKKEDDDEARLFAKWLKVGWSGLNQDEMAAALTRRSQIHNAPQSTTSGADGGYLIPEGFNTALEEAMKAYGGMREVAEIIRTASGNALPFPTTDDTANKGAILTENSQVSDQAVAFGQMTLNAYKYSSKLVKVSIELLQDSAFDLPGKLSGWLGTRIGRITNEHFTTGTGTDQPKGIVAAATLGVTAVGGQTSSILANDLINLEHSVDPAYRRGARFMMNDAWLKQIKKLTVSTTDLRPIWLPGYQVGSPDTILGYPYTINQDMNSASSASTKAVIFGQLSKYLIRDVLGVQVMRLNERYADYLQVGFMAFSRHDGDLLDAGTHPVKYFVTAAS